MATTPLSPASVSPLSPRRSSERGTTSAPRSIAQNTVRRFASPSLENTSDDNSVSEECNADDLASMQTLLGYVVADQTEPPNTIMLNGVTLTMKKSTQSNQSESQTVVVEFISNNETIGRTFSETIDVETLKSNIVMLQQKNVSETPPKTKTPTKSTQSSSMLPKVSRGAMRVLGDELTGASTFTKAITFLRNLFDFESGNLLAQFKSDELLTLMSVLENSTDSPPSCKVRLGGYTFIVSEERGTDDISSRLMLEQESTQDGVPSLKVTLREKADLNKLRQVALDKLAFLPLPDLFKRLDLVKNYAKNMNLAGLTIRSMDEAAFLMDAKANCNGAIIAGLTINSMEQVALLKDRGVNCEGAILASHIRPTCLEEVKQLDELKILYSGSEDRVAMLTNINEHLTAMAIENCHIETGLEGLEQELNRATIKFSIKGFQKDYKPGDAETASEEGTRRNQIVSQFKNVVGNELQASAAAWLLAGNGKGMVNAASPGINLDVTVLFRPDLQSHSHSEVAMTTNSAGQKVLIVTVKTIYSLHTKEKLSNVSLDKEGRREWEKIKASSIHGEAEATFQVDEFGKITLLECHGVRGKPISSQYKSLEDMIGKPRNQPLASSGGSTRSANSNKGWFRGLLT